MAQILTRDSMMAGARDITDIAKDVAFGGAGVATAMVGGRFVGDMVEEIVTSAPITADSSITSKIVAWLGNNTPKIAGAMIVHKIETGNEMLDKALVGFEYGLAGSVAIDTYARAGNNGVPTLVLESGANNRVQALVNENSQLKAAVRKLTGRTMPSTEAAAGGVIDAQVRRPVDKEFEFADRAMKRPLDEKYQFVGDPTSPEILAGFGFNM